MSEPEKKAYFDALVAAQTEQSIIFLDVEKRIIVFNAGAESNYGYSAKEVLGEPASVLDGAATSDAERIDAVHDQAAASGYAAARVVCRRKDGTTFPAYVHVTTTFDADGGPTGSLLTSRDLSDDERLREDLENAQNQLRADLLEISTPIMQVGDRILALPIIGTLDSGRTQTILENLLMAVQEREAEVIILDVSGVPAIDSIVGRNLLKAAQAARIMGAQTVISGIRPETAQTIVEIGIDFNHLRTRRNVQDAIKWAQDHLKGETADETPEAE